MTLNLLGCAAGTVIGIATVASPGNQAAHLSPFPSAGGESQVSKRARKDRGPNWTPQEVSALVNAKRNMFLEELDIVDGRDLMTPEAMKWQRVSEDVMRCGFSPCPRNGGSCKTKWHQIIPDYKKIADFFARTGRNGADYWDMTTSERKNEGLPRCFAKDLFYSIHEWFGSHPSMQPPHTRDLLSHEDGNFNIHRQQPASDQDVQDNDPISEDPMDIADEMEASNDTNGHT